MTIKGHTMFNAETASREQIAAATAYEKLFVKGLFSEWAPRVLKAIMIEPDHRILDVACGTGVLAQAAAERVGYHGSVVGLDPNPGMLAVAEQINPSIDWRQGIAEKLPFQDESFDAVVSQFGLMFFRSREQAITEMLRVLKPDAGLAIAVWDLIDYMPAYMKEAELVEQIAGEEACNALSAPFRLGDRNKLADLFKKAGTASVEVKTHSGTACFPSIRDMVEADLRGWLPVMDVVLTETQILTIMEKAEEILSPYVDEHGAVFFKTSAHIVTGKKH
jgi:ubiquinone/menaquinone biosynthesis C-methylase UbiE